MCGVRKPGTERWYVNVVQGEQRLCRMRRLVGVARGTATVDHVGLMRERRRLYV